MTRYDLVVAGCGSTKVDEQCQIGQLYTSNYFGLKGEMGEKLAKDWAVLSAEYNLTHHEAVVETYDTEIDDVDMDEFVDTLVNCLKEGCAQFETKPIEICVLATEDYAEAFKRAVDILEQEYDVLEFDVDYPFVEIDFDGIGKQMGWMRETIDEYEQ